MADDKHKGNATGFSGLSTLVSDVEDNRPASEPAPEIAETAVAGVCDAIFAAGPGLSAVLAALRAGDAAPEATRSASAPLEVPHMLQALRALEEQLQNADMAATDAMRALLGRAGATPGARLQALDEAVGALDFEGALVLCRALIGTLEVEQPA